MGAPNKTTLHNFSFDSLESVRKKLLDLSGRNALLNYKHPKASCVRIVDELPDQIYDVLDSGKVFTFIPVPEPTEKELMAAGYMLREPVGSSRLVKNYPTAEEWAKHLGFDVRHDLPDVDISKSEKKRHHDTNLQTLLYGPQLESRLRSIRGKAETAIEETGGNILYLALGFVQWRESHDSDLERLAPLFTIPVRLERKKLDRSEGVYRYTLTMKDDGLLSNITLREMLANDFGLVLPLIDDDTSPEAYFDLIESTIIKQQPRWKLRRQASLVQLNFSKQAMYQDLDPANWPDDARIEEHPIIQMFFGGGSSGNDNGNTSYTEEYGIDDIDDVHENFPLIYDADSSQHSALIDAVDGKSIVIEGPPGSGKSQTITNLIAACISSGQKVLFVAEKMAALSVVKNRLDKAGLGDFCLELHSHKTNKLKLLDDLTRRLNKQDQFRYPESIDSDIARYEDLKEKLSSYAVEINSVWKNTGMTIHQILNRATRYREHYGVDPNTLRIAGVDGDLLTTVKQKEIIDSADMLATIYDQVSAQAEDGVIARHYWYGVNNYELRGYELEGLGKLLQKYNDSLIELSKDWGDRAENLHFGIGENTPLSHVRQYIEQLNKLPELQGGELLANMEYISSNEESFHSMLGHYQDIHKVIANLADHINSASIYQKDTTQGLSKTLQVFSGLGLPLDTSLQTIAKDKGELLRLSNLAIEIKQQFGQILPSLPAGLEECFKVTENGLNEFVILVDSIRSLEAELWRYRDELYDNVDIDPLLAKLTATLRNLAPKHNALISQFSLHRLPSHAELKKYQSIVDNAGIFKLFSAEWRHARRELLALSAQAKPNEKIIFPLLPKLVDYVAGIEKIDRINKEDPLLEDLYKGAETPINRIIKLRAWYRSVRSEYGIGFGERVAIGSQLLSLDRKLAIGIADVADHGLLDTVKDFMESISSLSQRYAEFHAIRSKNVVFDNVSGPLPELLGVLSENLSMLANIVRHETTTLGAIEEHCGQVVSLKEKADLWHSNSVRKGLVPGVLPLSIEPGEFSDHYLNAAKNTLDIARVIAISPALHNSIFSEPTSVRYNELRASHRELSALLIRQDNDKDLFFDAGKVKHTEWTELCGDAMKSLINRNQHALDNPNWLNTWLEYVRLKNKLCGNGLDNIVAGLEAEKIQTKNLNDIVQLAIFHQLSEEILSEHSEMSAFSGLEQAAIREKFQEYDRKLMILQREKVAYKASRKMPVVGNASGRVSTYTEASLIKHEAGKKSRHIAVRELIKRAGESIQTLKPCFMMSPMSVAQYLKPGQFEFDLVVMDEASQIRPEDALGAIARGKRLVVVGDPKQLPPTTFFSKALDNDDGTDVVALQDSESILESVIPMFPTRRLRWHYRSRHESLIAFSNQNFYDSNLILFPSPFQETDEFGIRFTRVERGRFHTSRNVEEAQELVKMLADQVIEHPDESVGVVAMNSEQRDEIERQWDQRVKDDPVLQQAHEKMMATDDPMFIKNLENVQGDERDVIVISLTYGPEQVGGRTMQRFGPINSNVGWRRLNVLFTRSKKRMHIFSSLASGDILAGEGKSRGVRALRAFLEYCESGHLHAIKHTGRAPDSDFEVAVMRMLSDHGYECEPQLGVAGYFLDLAVRDPGKPGSFLMGVECDGATYHSAKSARDRDRLRQDILENLGWRIRRIWSTDWFKNPQAQLQPILQELERLKTPLPSIDVGAEERVGEAEAVYSPLNDLGDLNDDVTPDCRPITQAVEGQGLKDRLQNFNEQVIKKRRPDTEEDHRLLRPAMLEALLNHLPCSKAEFLEHIPGYLRTGTAVDEGKEYLQPVLELIADFG
ncbi:hypothetical protein A9Q89_06485 [Gammaproteobacteria bacterium 53_120_T64]|nr:hypothetical protein A9Q89_06485 [Gammaproteobacteria bacterium 53_120_T64]